MPVATHAPLSLALRPLAALTLGILASTALFLHMQKREYDIEQFRFELAADTYVSALRGNVEATVTAQRATHRRSVPTFEAGALIEGALPAAGALEAFVSDVSVYAGTSANDRMLAYRRQNAPISPTAGGIRLPAWLHIELAPFSRTFTTAGAPWHIVIRAAPRPPGPGDSGPVLALLTGSLISAAIASFMRTQAVRARRVRRMVDQRTIQLKIANTRLRHDIAARQRVEQDLLHAQQVLTIAQKVAHMGSWELDAATGDLECSDELYRICGLQPQSVKTTVEFLLGLIHPDDREVAKQAIHAIRFQGKDFSMKSRMVRPDGSIRHVISIGEATRDDQQQLIRAVGALMDVTEQKEAELALRRSQEELRLLVAHDERIREDERQRIAREVHDELGGVLTGIKAYLSVALERAPVTHPGKNLLTEAAALADQATDTVRKVITDLRPSVLDQLGVWAALQWYASQVEKHSGMRCECAIDEAAAAVQLDPDRSTALFRIVQEALTNVTRHASASQVWIRASLREQCLHIEVRDNGVGIKACRSHGRTAWGIVGMQERARHLGGEFSIADAAAGGTVAMLRLPTVHSNEGET